ncbi:hypothetical protein BDZ85DRAFT_268164 [Elsinoe ampelina]|uniref:Uncharacterized protein n=1 Tax=Elsinoe ampelina TaxID=302913 RepID=A0A6A6G250_9PEZI|nr:hypothetical protein BDZ85DRAFT_268164 [Elsinoe ampelina]
MMFKPKAKGRRLVGVVSARPTIMEITLVLLRARSPSSALVARKLRSRLSPLKMRLMWRLELIRMPRWPTTSL